MSFGGTGNNSNLPNLSITGALPPDEKRRRWMWIAAQCRNLINYADLGDNPNNINQWPEAYRVTVSLLQLLDSLDPERSQPPIMAQTISHNFSDLAGINQPPRITTPLPEQPIHTYVPGNPPLHDIAPKMPIYDNSMGPPRNPPNYIFPRVQNTVGPPQPKRQYTQISKDDNTQILPQGKQLSTYSINTEQSFVATPNSMYSPEYNPNIAATRIPYSDVQYTEQVPVKKKRDNLKKKFIREKKF